MAELGPELFRTPSGKWGMAMTDGLYPMIPGTYVFTAAQFRRMWEHWTGQSYARGGRGCDGYPDAASGPATAQHLDHQHVPRQAKHHRQPAVAVTQDDLTFIMTEVADATVSAVQNARDAKGRCPRRPYPRSHLLDKYPHLGWEVGPSDAEKVYFVFSPGGRADRLAGRGIDLVSDRIPGSNRTLYMDMGAQPLRLETRLIFPNKAAFRKFWRLSRTPDCCG